MREVEVANQIVIIQRIERCLNIIPCFLEGNNLRAVNIFINTRTPLHYQMQQLQQVIRVHYNLASCKQFLRELHQQRLKVWIDSLDS